MNDLKLTDVATGITEDCGVVAAMREIGTAAIYLTYSESDQVWWIIVLEKPRGLWKLGYLLNRREDAWETFRQMDADELDELKRTDPSELAMEAN